MSRGARPGKAPAAPRLGFHCTPRGAWSPGGIHQKFLQEIESPRSLAPLLPSLPAPPSPCVCVLLTPCCLLPLSPLASLQALSPALPGCPPLPVCAKGSKRSTQRSNQRCTPRLTLPFSFLHLRLAGSYPAPLAPWPCLPVLPRPPLSVHALSKAISKANPIPLYPLPFCACSLGFPCALALSLPPAVLPLPPLSAHALSSALSRAMSDAISTALTFTTGHIRLGLVHELQPPEGSTLRPPTAQAPAGAVAAGGRSICRGGCGPSRPRQPPGHGFTVPPGGIHQKILQEPKKIGGGRGGGGCLASHFPAHSWFNVQPAVLAGIRAGQGLVSGHTGSVAVCLSCSGFVLPLPPLAASCRLPFALVADALPRVFTSHGGPRWVARGLLFFFFCWAGPWGWGQVTGHIYTYIHPSIHPSIPTYIHSGRVLGAYTKQQNWGL